MALGGALALSDRRYRAVAHATNLAVLRQQLAELKADMQAGSLSPAHYAEARAELERRVLEETAAGAPRALPRPRRAARWAAALGVPAAAAALYLHLGSPASLLSPKPAEAPVSAEQIEAMVARLAARLERQPNDTQGWSVLGLSYFALQRYPEAAAAYAQLAELSPRRAQALADQAEALAMAQGRRMGGKPLELARRALELDPRQWKALALLASDAFARQDYPLAIAHWEALQAAAPPGSQLAASVPGYID